MILAFAGLAGSGKSTAAQYLEGRAPRHARVFNFADPLKKAVLIAWGFNHAQLYGDAKEVIDARYGVSPRRVMQHFGTEHVRSLCPDLWVHRMRERVGTHMTTSRYTALIGDLRFGNEFAAIKDWGGTTVWLDRKSTSPMPGATHASENALLEHVQQGRFDYVIENHGEKRELFAQLDEIVKENRS